MTCIIGRVISVHGKSHGSKLVTNIRGRGRQNRLWVLGTLIYEGIKLEREKECFETGFNIQKAAPSLSPQFFICPSPTQ
jgi:hypothetical protein